MLRYTKLRDDQIMMRLLEVAEKERLTSTNDGLEAIIFTAQGDMRQVWILTQLTKHFSHFLSIRLGKCGYQYSEHYCV